LLVNRVALCVKIAAMRRIWLCTLISALLISVSARCFAQAGGGHLLFGDFKVDDSKAAEFKPVTFHLILYTRGGRVMGRESVSNNGRYRFFDVTN
jgi:hypothetical protein